MNKNRGEEKDLKTYLDMLSFLSGSSDDYFFCLDYEFRKIYFFGDLIKKCSEYYVEFKAIPNKVGIDYIFHHRNPVISSFV